MLNSIFLPFLIQLSTASILLEDGHEITAQFVQRGAVSHASGFLIKIGDVADIQASLSSNSCLIRIEDLKETFDTTLRAQASRCDRRVDVYRSQFEETQALNKALKKEIKEEKSFSTRVLWVSSASVLALTALSFYVRR